jgi:hypothetical protein
MGGVVDTRRPALTVVAGALLIVAAMVGGAFVGASGLPGWSKAVLLVLALVLGLTGALMTLRDLSPPRRRRR